MLTRWSERSISRVASDTWLVPCAVAASLICQKRRGHHGLVPVQLSGVGGHCAGCQAFLAWAGALQAAPLRAGRQGDRGVEVSHDDGVRGRRPCAAGEEE